MTDNIFDENCSYCAEGALLDAFGIKIGELPMSKVILFKEQSHRGRIIVACKKHVDDISDLSKEERAQYMEDVSHVASIMNCSSRTRSTSVPMAIRCTICISTSYQSIKADMSGVGYSQ